MILGLVSAAVLLAGGSDAQALPPVQSSIQAPGPLGPLKGTLLSPARGRAPLVLIIPGSGPTDRDGNNPLGVKAASYRLLGEALAERAVASVRIDKRGMFASAGAVSDPDSVTIDDYVADVHAWVAAAKAATGSPCVWLLGHSEGGLVALAAAQKAKDVCGLILVSTPGRPLGAVLREQLRANPANAPVLEEAEAAISALEAGRPVDASRLNPALLPLFRPSVQGFLMSVFRLDPEKLIAAYPRPTAILQGEADLQVNVGDAQRLKAAQPRASLTLLPDVNHVLKVVKGSGRAANAATYADPFLPIAPEIADTVARFIAANPPGASAD